MQKLREADERIINPKIVNYFEECVDTLKALDIMPENWGNDIELVQNKALHTFGSMQPPKYSNNSFILRLSSYMFGEPEEAIKNTIYHELCHYIQMKQQIEEGILWFGDRGLYKTRKADNAYESSHGGRWQAIAKRVSIATGQNIQRTDNYETHTGVGQAYEKGIKYVIKCKRCGQTFKYHKRTDFVNCVLTNTNHSWRCRCGSKDFELVGGSEYVGR